MILVITAFLAPLAVAVATIFIKRTIDHFDQRNADDHAQVRRRLDDMTGLLMTTAASTVRTEGKVDVLDLRVGRLEHSSAKGEVDSLSS